jgi:thiol-disulfide isomerase/thioredoxin
MIEKREKSGSELWKEIIGENRGKVIYIDCWGTWCGSCIAEFPYSRTMMEKYSNSDIEFIYLCFNSKKYKWEEIVSAAKFFTNLPFTCTTDAFASLSFAKSSINNDPTLPVLPKIPILIILKTFPLS